MAGKENIYASVMKKKEQYELASDRIWEYAELRYQENKSSKELISILEKEGFGIETDLAGIPTAFMGSYGHGSPVIGILGEFDALEGLSQEAGVAKKCPVVPGGNGHGCGHNCLGAGALAGAVAVKDYLLEHPDTNGTIIYLGCPAEESGAGKVFMARAGVFKRLDVALSWHPGSSASICSGSTLAVIHMEVDFHGVASHAAIAPENGRSALDAAELMNIGVQFLREHMQDKARIHYAFLDAGGNASNVVQAKTTLSYSIRAPRMSDAKKLQGRVEKIAQGAALMTDTQMSFRIVSALSEQIPNTVLERILQKNLEEAPFPVYTDDEEAFGVEINKTYEMQESATDMASTLHNDWKKILVDHAGKKGGWSLNDIVLPYRHCEEPMCVSTDVGDVSYVCPTATFFAPTTAARVPAHSWQHVACNKTGIAHKGLIYAGQVLAGACIDLLENPKLVEEAKEKMQERKLKRSSVQAV